MQDLKAIRSSLNLSQESLAAYLQVSRQSVDKVERGLRELTSTKLIKLARLEACMHKSRGRLANKEAFTQKSNVEEELKREKECRYLAMTLQRQLDAVEQSLINSQHLHDALCTLEPMDEGDALWIQKTKKDILNKLDNCKTDTCMRLRKRIYLLMSEADYIRTMLTLTTSTHEEQ